MRTGTVVNSSDLNFAGIEDCVPTQSILSSCRTTAPLLKGCPRPGMRRSVLMPTSFGAACAGRTGRRFCDTGLDAVNRIVKIDDVIVINEKDEGLGPLKLYLEA